MLCWRSQLMLGRMPALWIWEWTTMLSWAARRGRGVTVSWLSEISSRGELTRLQVRLYHAVCSEAICCQSFKSTCCCSQGSGGVRSLYLPIPGTYYFTSATPGACTGGRAAQPLHTASAQPDSSMPGVPSVDRKLLFAAGLLFAAQVPPGSGSVCPVGVPPPARPTVTTSAPAPSSEV